MNLQKYLEALCKHTLKGEYSIPLTAHMPLLSSYPDLHAHVPEEHSAFVSVPHSLSDAVQAVKNQNIECIFVSHQTF